MTLDELRTFCEDEDSTRFGLQNPFSQGEWQSGTSIVKTSKGQTFLGSVYVEKIRKLPGIKIGLFGTESDRRDNPPLCLMFDGGVGLLMPVRKMSNGERSD